MITLTYTDENIEDWDFRSYRSPFLEGGLAASDPMVLFLQSHWGRVLLIDCLRLRKLNAMIDSGVATLSPDGDVTLTLAGEQSLPYMTRPRDALSHSGRENRRIVKSLAREWSKYGRLRYTVLPFDLSESFAGLFAGKPPDDPYAGLARERAAMLHTPAT